MPSAVAALRNGKEENLVKAWRLTPPVSVNTMNVSNLALKLALPCWCLGCHSKGVSTHKLPSVWMQSWVGYFTVDCVRAPLLPITSHSWMHAGYRVAPGAAVWTCVEGAEWDHHLVLSVLSEWRREASMVWFASIKFPFSLSQTADTGMTALCSTGVFFLRQWYLSSWSHWYSHKRSH